MGFKTVKRIIILCRGNQVKAIISQDLDHQTFIVATCIQVARGSWKTVLDSSTKAWGSYSPLEPLWWACDLSEALALSKVLSMRRHPSSTWALQVAASHPADISSTTEYNRPGTLKCSASWKRCLLHPGSPLSIPLVPFVHNFSSQF